MCKWAFVYACHAVISGHAKQTNTESMNEVDFARLYAVLACLGASFLATKESLSDVPLSALM